MQRIGNPTTIPPSVPVGKSVVGVDVAQVQRQLQALGLYDRVVDGKDGAYTAAAVLAYQRGQLYFPGLLVDGVWGQLTQQHYEWVKKLQTALNQWKTASRIGKTKVDGSYGAFGRTLVHQTIADNFLGSYREAVWAEYGKASIPKNDSTPGRAFCRMLSIPVHPCA